MSPTSWADMSSTSWDDMDGDDVQSSNPQLQAYKEENIKKQKEELMRQKQYFAEQQKRREQRNHPQQQQQPQQQRQRQQRQQRQQPQQQRQRQLHQQQLYVNDIKVGDTFRATASRDENKNPYFSGVDKKMLNLKLYNSNNKFINHQNSNIGYCSILWNKLYDENSEFEVEIKSINDKNEKLQIQCSFTQNLPKFAEDCIEISALEVGMKIRGRVRRITDDNIFFTPSNILNLKNDKMRFNIWKYNKDLFRILYNLEVGSEFDNLIVIYIDYNLEKRMWTIDLQVVLDLPILLLDINGLIANRQYNPDRTVTTTLYENCYKFLDWCESNFYLGFTTCGDVKDVPDSLIEKSNLGVISGFKSLGWSKHIKEKPRYDKDDWTIRKHLGGIFCGPIRVDGNKMILESSTKVLVVDDKYGDEKIESFPYGSAIYLPDHDENSLNEGSPIYDILTNYIGSDNIKETTFKLLKEDPFFNRYLPGNILESSQDVFPEIPFQNTTSTYLTKNMFKQMLQSEVNSQKETYCATEKSDGVRAFLVFSKGVFLVDRTNTRYQIEIGNNSISNITDGTILDGELVFQKQNEISIVSYLVFDVIDLVTNNIMSSTSSSTPVSTKVNLSDLNLSKKLDLIKCYSDLDLKFMDKIPGFDTDTFTLKVKTLYNLQNLKSLVDRISFSEDEYFYTDEGTTTKIDGIMITNMEENETYKWKYPQKLTVDYMMTKNDFLSPNKEKNLSLRNSDIIYKYELPPNSYIHTEIESYFKSNSERTSVILECNRSQILRLRYDKKNPNSMETREEIINVLDSNFDQNQLLMVKPLSVNAPEF